MRFEAVAAGVLAELLAVSVGATLPLPREIRETAAFGLLTVGLVGGYVAGTFADGNWRSGVVHGALAGAGGGAVLAAVLVYTMLTPGTAVGALWGLNYLVATSGIPPWLVQKYGTLVVAGVAALTTVLFVAEGALAGGAAGTARVEPPTG